MLSCSPVHPSGHIAPTSFSGLQRHFFQPRMFRNVSLSASSHWAGRLHGWALAPAQEGWLCSREGGGTHVCLSNGRRHWPAEADCRLRAGEQAGVGARLGNEAQRKQWVPRGLDWQSKNHYNHPNRPLRTRHRGAEMMQGHDKGEISSHHFCISLDKKQVPK